MPHQIKKLLLVVSDDTLRIDLKRILARVERLHVAESPSTGIEHLAGRPSPPDLYLLDRRALTKLRERARTDTIQEHLLTVQEQDVLRRLALGLRTTDIALVLGRSPKTVEKHRSSIHRKLGLRSVAQLTAYAIHVGLVTVERVLRGE